MQVAPLAMVPQGEEQLAQAALAFEQLALVPPPEPEQVQVELPPHEPATLEVLVPVVQAYCTALLQAPFAGTTAGYGGSRTKTLLQLTLPPPLDP